MKFENIFGKKVKELETLSQSLVYREKELLHTFKDKAKENDLEENIKNYEKRRLLEQSDSDEENEKSEDEMDFSDSKVAIETPEVSKAHTNQE